MHTSCVGHLLVSEGTAGSFAVVVVLACLPLFNTINNHKWIFCPKGRDGFLIKWDENLFIQVFEWKHIWYPTLLSMSPLHWAQQRTGWEWNVPCPRAEAILLMGACLKVTEAGPRDACPCTIRRMDHVGTHPQPPSARSVLLNYQCCVPSAGGQTGRRRWWLVELPSRCWTDALLSIQFNSIQFYLYSP